MPIIGLTKENEQNVFDGLPLLGRIRKGAEKGKKRPGADLDHFRFTAESPYLELGIQDVFREMYGDEPKMFDNVKVAGSTPDEAFPTWMEEWGSGKTLKLRSDGKTVFVEWVPNKNRYSDEPRPVKPGELENAKPVGRLILVFEDFCREIGIPGVIMAETHSKHDIMAVDGYLKTIKTLYGTLIGIPFTFGRVERDISTPMGNGRRALTTKSLFFMHVDRDFTRHALMGGISQNMATLARPAQTQQLADAVSNGILAFPDHDSRALAAIDDGPIGRYVDGTAALQPNPVESEDETAEDKPDAFKTHREEKPRRTIVADSTPAEEKIIEVRHLENGYWIKLLKDGQVGTVVYEVAGIETLDDKRLKIEIIDVATGQKMPNPMRVKPDYEVAHVGSAPEPPEPDGTPSALAPKPDAVEEAEVTEPSEEDDERLRTKDDVEKRKVEHKCPPVLQRETAIPTTDYTLEHNGVTWQTVATIQGKDVCATDLIAIMKEGKPVGPVVRARTKVLKPRRNELEYGFRGVEQPDGQGETRVELKPEADCFVMRRVESEADDE